MVLPFKKYFSIIRIELQRQLAHRSNIMAYVIGDFFGLFAQTVVWTVIFKTQDSVRGFTFPEMMTYVVIGWFFMNITSNYGFEHQIASDIHYGRLTQFMVKPMDYLKYAAALSVGRLSIAFFVVLAEGAVCISLFSPYLIFDASLSKFLALLAMLVLSFMIQLSFSFLIGLISFWTANVSGLESFIKSLSKILSGAFFPISILSAGFLKVSLFFPFAYILFVPTQFYIGKMDGREALAGIGVQFAWLILLYFIIKAVWRTGLKKYEGYGI